MRKVSMATREELISAVRDRYQSAQRREKSRILDEFARITGYCRKHGMRLMRSERATRQSSRPGRRLYDDAVCEALTVLWEASDRICSKRLKVMIPILVGAMERSGHLDLDGAIKERLLQMSPATIDRALKEIRATATGAPRRRTAGQTALRRSIPIRTFDDWDEPAPGHFEADLVSHSGPVAKGSFAQTLVLTDIATGWTECAPLLFREQNLLVAVLNEMRVQLPMAVLGFDTDNDSVFLNPTVRDWCAANSITFTRCRPYRKNDQAWVEQKNGAIVRRAVGYRRFDGIEATSVLAQLYALQRYYGNFFQPSFKLAEKHRDGAKVMKRYHVPATPAQRLIDDPRTTDVVRAQLAETMGRLDPVKLLRQIRDCQERLVALADKPGGAVVANDITLDQFFAGLRTAWQIGEARATARAKPQPKRGRRRPDPVVAVTDQLHAWYRAEPWRTGRELMERLQREHPDQYPDKLLRTIQRRLKIWRAEEAQRLVFGPRKAADEIFAHVGTEPAALRFAGSVPTCP